MGSGRGVFATMRYTNPYLLAYYIADSCKFQEAGLIRLSVRMPGKFSLHWLTLFITMSVATAKLRENDCMKRFR